MGYNEKLADRIRTALAHLPDVKEKKMFGHLAFMVNGKLCVSAAMDKMMFRIDPALHNEVIKKEGCTPVMMGGREYKGYVDVNEGAFKSNKDFSYWMGLAIDFNKTAKAAKK
jgi:TfoX/Sxy family transcriptional regulator of competence genes